VVRARRGNLDGWVVACARVERVVHADLPSLGEFAGEVAAIPALHCQVLMAGEEGVERCVVR
jgi:hypothetical protein